MEVIDLRWAFFRALVHQSKCINEPFAVFCALFDPLPTLGKVDQDWFRRTDSGDGNLVGLASSNVHLRCCYLRTMNRTKKNLLGTYSNATVLRS